MKATIKLRLKNPSEARGARRALKAMGYDIKVDRLVVRKAKAKKNPKRRRARRTRSKSRRKR